jgi:hypothetical protein
LLESSKPSIKEATMPDAAQTAIITAIISALVSLSVGLGTIATNYALTSRQNDEKMIELAVDILKANCTSNEGVVPARKWAVNVIQHFAPSGVPLDEDTKKALLEVFALLPGSFSKDFSSDFDVGPHSPCLRMPSLVGPKH